MKTAFVAALIAAASAFTFAPANADTFVNGYYRSNGTYVAPHYRSDPDGIYNNNWSVQGNVNPYTGQYGTRAPLYIAPPADYYKRPITGGGIFDGPGIFNGPGIFD